MDRCLIGKKIELVIKNYWINESVGLDGLIVECYYYLKENTNYKFFLKLKRKEYFLSCLIGLELFR